jgi:hypothetical protein
MAHSMRRVVSQAKTSPGWAAAVLAMIALAGVFTAAATTATGCTTTTTVPGPFCEGGYVRTVAGSTKQTCEGLCSPAACANPGNVCIDNRCQLECATLLDCPSGQECVAATTDGPDGGAGGTMTMICQNNGKAAIGAACPFGNECKPASPPAAGGAQPACPDGSNCDYTQCGGNACTPDPVACAGFSGNCPIGLCDDGSSCTVPGCTADKCKALVCLSDAPAGGADEAAYCTLQDCHADTDCPGGFWCEKVHDPHQICGQPKPSANCGTTTDPCVDPSMDMANGTTYAKGTYCTLRSECHLRRACDPCASDLDCSGSAGRHCTTVGADKFCVEDCAGDSDCVNGFQCTTGECVPRSGACTGAGKFCESCHDDTECGTGLECVQFEVGGERVCVYPTIACSADSDCPVAPSGLHGYCEVDSGSGICLIPLNTGSGEFTCWPSNKGAACYLSTECISKHCLGSDAADQVPGNCQ